MKSKQNKEISLAKKWDIENKPIKIVEVKSNGNGDKKRKDRK